MFRYLLGALFYLTFAIPGRRNFYRFILNIGKPELKEIKLVISGSPASGSVRSCFKALVLNFAVLF